MKVGELRRKSRNCSFNTCTRSTMTITTCVTELVTARAIINSSECFRGDVGRVATTNVSRLASSDAGRLGATNNVYSVQVPGL